MAAVAISTWSETMVDLPHKLRKIWATRACTFLATTAQLSWDHRRAHFEILSLSNTLAMEPGATPMSLWTTAVTVPNTPNTTGHLSNFSCRPSGTTRSPLLSTFSIQLSTRQIWLNISSAWTWGTWLSAASRVGSSRKCYSVLLSLGKTRWRSRGS